MKGTALPLAVLLCLGALHLDADQPPPVATPASPGASFQKPVPEKVQPFDTLLAEALAAYNEGNREKLFAGFATTAKPSATPEVYRALFEEFYKATLGKFISRELNVKETSPDPDYAMVVWDAKFEKAAKVKVSANFIRESATPKIVQIRMEKL